MNAAVDHCHLVTHWRAADVAPQLRLGHSGHCGGRQDCICHFPGPVRWLARRSSVTTEMAKVRERKLVAATLNGSY